MISFCQEHDIDYHIKEKTITEEWGGAMALLQDLIQQIDDPALKERILQETNKIIGASIKKWT